MYTQITIKSRAQVSATIESISFEYSLNDEVHSLETLFPVGATEADVREFLEI